MMEVITTHDKDVRDRLFQDLRKNGNELEKQVVKFSGNEPVIGETGFPLAKIVGFRRGDTKRPIWRNIYRSTWSVAYPAERAS